MTVVKEKKPRCKLIGTDGNIFALLGRASGALRKAGQKEKAKELVKKVFHCKSYSEALGLIQEYVEAY